MEDRAAPPEANFADAGLRESGMGAVASDDDHSSGTSSAGNESDGFSYFDDSVKEFLCLLRANDKATDEIDFIALSESKWDLLEEDCLTETQIEQEVNGDIVEIFEALAHNTVVRKVNLGFYLNSAECRISHIGAEAIAQALSSNQTILELTLSANGMKRTQMHTVLRGLRRNANNTRVRKLRIEGHFMDDIMGQDAPSAFLLRNEMRVLSELLSENSSIEELELVYNAVEWESCCPILCDALTRNSTIKILNVLDNHFLDASESRRLCAAASDETAVKVRANTSPGLPDLVRHSKNLDELHVRFIRELDNNYWRELIAAFKENSSVRDVSFFNSSNVEEGTYDDHLPLVLDAMSNQIERVGFKDILMGDKGLRAICKALSRSNSIRELDLMNCSKDGKPITQFGVEALLSLLRECKTFVSVKLRVDRSGFNYYRLGDEAALAIARAVMVRRGNTKEICLKRCGIGDEGAAALCRLLDVEHAQIEALDLGGNAFGFSVCAEFAKRLCRNEHLQSLDLAGAREGANGASQTKLHILFFDSLKSNRTLRCLSLPFGASEYTTAEKMRQYRAFRDLLQVNHTVNDISCLSSIDDVRHLGLLMSKANQKPPILASTMKHAPFPAYLLKDMSGGKFANALARADNVAGIDGVFSMLRQVSGDAIDAGSDQKRRGREE